MAGDRVVLPASAIAHRWVFRNGSILEYFVVTHDHRHFRRTSRARAYPPTWQPDDRHFAQCWTIFPAWRAAQLARR